MRFHTRSEAGKLLARALAVYRNKEVIIYALPRGGVITAFEIAMELHAPLDLIIPRKIGHPLQPEYAIAAITEHDAFVGNEEELQTIDPSWLKQAINQEQEEAKRRRETYLSGKKLSVKNKTAIVVDDGIATGLTMRAAVRELKRQQPQEIIVAVPVAPLSTIESLKREVTKVIALESPTDEDFLGAIGAYYDKFPQVTDEEVTMKLASNQSH